KFASASPNSPTTGCERQSEPPASEPSRVASTTASPSGTRTASASRSRHPTGAHRTAASVWASATDLGARPAVLLSLDQIAASRRLESVPWRRGPRSNRTDLLEGLQSY